MHNELAPLIFELCAIIISAALLGTLFLYARQPIILAYIAAGVLIGPHGINLVTSAENITQIGNLGVILLLFLIGLNLQPKKLLSLFQESASSPWGRAPAFLPSPPCFA
ncbi:glutathione-regulated potassium-efflux system protein KefB [Photobacterium aphoticum]|uniref:Glutathione-regulated potassium-efflux system protein KefB n=1 Tax=Photobacterium aphoticum TaxID=754436 RepID=A0A090QJ25_9GAMM|nr:glutathione-regulated potassium-efflux system protein KefB [Photobacterium aphoticum]